MSLLLLLAGGGPQPTIVAGAIDLGLVQALPSIIVQARPLNSFNLKEEDKVRRIPLIKVPKTDSS